MKRQKQRTGDSGISEEKFLSLIESHKGIIYKITRIYCREAETQKDLEQEILIELWKSYPRYDPEYRWSTWMYRIALNVAISYYRKESRRRETFTDIEEPVIVRDREEESISRGEVKRLYKYIGKLQKLNRALILLYLDGIRYKDIAEILNLTETNVATKIQRIKQQLKKEFSERED
ncbi:MAG: sigma-70 family RNA polymerase sigma factor [Candidatus Marinimicrobia bacterium]|nr:sigma-70 family RNA polymerase sigma factor [Candidatus Neomarinimicrobiota bacterium]